MRQYPGGFDRMADFISANYKYPDIALKYNLTGKVLVSFTVDSIGNIQNPFISRSLHPLLDTEALRVLTSMPKWRPGLLEKKPVNVLMTIPIQLEIDN